jgi:predicted GIY-YIG superfamily endonuclease
VIILKRQLKFEKQVKGWSRQKKEALMDGNWEKFMNLQSVKTHLLILKDPWK